MMFAQQPNPIDRAGRIMLFQPSIPLEGSQPRRREKIKIIIRATQKEGIAIPSIPKTVAKPSITEYCLIAEIVPRGMAITRL